MKRVAILITLIAALVGCSKDGIHRYTFVYDANVPRYGVVIYLEEYNGDQCVAINKVDNPKVAQKYKFKSSPRAEYVVVRIVLAEDEDYSVTRYVSNVFYLDKYNTDIVLGSKTQVQGEMP